MSQFCTRLCRRRPPRRRLHQHVGRRLHRGQRVAVKRAVTAARLYLNATVPTLDEAAVSCGSNIKYVRAAIAVLQSERVELLNQILTGQLSLLQAAAQVRNLARLVQPTGTLIRATWRRLAASSEPIRSSPAWSSRRWRRPEAARGAQAMSGRQQDLFSDDPLIGLRVRLKRAIDRRQPCHGNLGEIHPGRGPHAYRLLCTACGRFRGWLSKPVAEFLAEVVRVGGVPDEPLTLRDATLEAREELPLCGKPSHPVAQAGTHTPAPKGTTTMKMTDYGSNFVRYEDVARDGPHRGKIADVTIGKFDRPVLELDTGALLTLNATNTTILNRALGTESDDWIGAEVEFYAGQTKYDGKLNDSVLVRVLSAPPKREARTPRNGMDDEIPFSRGNGARATARFSCCLLTFDRPERRDPLRPASFYRNVAAMNTSAPYEFRLALRAAGFSPVPCNGKAPPMRKWSTIEATITDIQRWDRAYPKATNTGMLTKLTPTFDVDIMNPEAAADVEHLVRERLDERGVILVRFGRPPKRAIPMRTSVPFKKIAASLTAADGSEAKLELLGDGQQVVVAGIHPDTNKLYTWHGGELGKIKHGDLPEITEEEGRALVEAAVLMLVEKHGYVRAKERPKANGKGSAAGDSAADWSYLTNNILNGQALHDRCAISPASSLHPVWDPAPPSTTCAD